MWGHRLQERIAVQILVLAYLLIWIVGCKFVDKGTISCTSRYPLHPSTYLGRRSRPVACVTSLHPMTGLL